MDVALIDLLELSWQFPSFNLRHRRRILLIPVGLICIKLLGESCVVISECL